MQVMALYYWVNSVNERKEGKDRYAWTAPNITIRERTIDSSPPVENSMNLCVSTIALAEMKEVTTHQSIPHQSTLFESRDAVTVRDTSNTSQDTSTHHSD